MELKRWSQRWGMGMRTIKTGLSIWLAFWLSDVFTLPNATLAALTAVVAIQPSLKGSVSTAKSQLIGTALGCVTAVAVAYYFPGSYTAIALGAVLAIAICVRFNLKNSVDLLLVTIIVISQTPVDNFQVAVVQRICMVVLGLLIGIGLNFLIRPQYQHRLQAHMDDLRLEFEQLYRDCAEDLRRETHLEKHVVQQRVMALRDQIQETRNLYKLSVDSRLGYDERTERDDLYLARRTINAIASNLERLVEMHRSIVLAPGGEENRAVREHVYQYLMDVLYNHQRIFDFVLLDQPFQDSMMQSFDCREEEIAETMLGLLGDTRDLLRMHYWNVTVEAERIMYKTWNLSRMKREMQGEKVDWTDLESLYHLQ